MIKILIVNDEKAEPYYYKNLIKEILRDCNIFSAKNSFQAIQLLNMEQFDAIFLDIDLMEVSGIELTGKIRDIDRYYMTPIIFISEKNMNNDEMNRKYKNHWHINKPCTVQKFNEIVSPILSSLKISEEYKRLSSQIIIETRKKQYVINQKDILFAEIHNKILTVHLVDRKITNISMPLIEFMRRVNSPSLIKCYTSCAVNIDKIFVVNETGRKTWSVEFNIPDSPTCPIGASYIDDVLELLDEKANYSKI